MASPQKFGKWAGYVHMDLAQLIDFMSTHGISMQEDKSVITGVTYDPEKQMVKIFLTSMLPPKEDKSFAKDHYALFGIESIEDEKQVKK